MAGRSIFGAFGAPASPSGASFAGRKAGPSYRTILTVLIIAEFATALESTMIYVALAKLYGIYGDPAHVSWLVTAGMLSSAATAAICSRLGDLFGRRKLLILLLLIAMIGSGVSALASDLNVIIFGRVLQGVSLAILPLAFGILRENAKDDGELNFGIGILGGTYSVSVGVAIVLGGVIVDHAGWQHIFTASACAAAVALILAVRFIPTTVTRARPGKIDLLGLLFTVPVCALLLALTLAQTRGWTSPVTLGLLIGGVVALALWVAHELRHPDPLIDLRLLAHPTIAIVNATIFFAALAPMLYPLVVMPLLQQPSWTGIGLGLTATMAGLLKLPTNLTAAISGFAAGFVARRHSMRPAIVASAIAYLVAFGGIILVHNSVIFVISMCFLLIAPAGTIMFACAPALIIEAAPPERTSEAAGLSSVLRAIAFAVGSQLIAFCLSTSSIVNGAGAKFPDEHAYIVTFIVVEVCCLASLLFALIIPRRKQAVISAPARSSGTRP
jgi:MFS family permease